MSTIMDLASVESVKIGGCIRSCVWIREKLHLKQKNSKFWEWLRLADKKKRKRKKHAGVFWMKDHQKRKSPP